MRCYRLCVLDDGIWFVIHAGTLDYIKARQREYRVLGYDTPEETEKQLSKTIDLIKRLIEEKGLKEAGAA